MTAYEQQERYSIRGRRRKRALIRRRRAAGYALVARIYSLLANGALETICCFAGYAMLMKVLLSVCAR